VFPIAGYIHDMTERDSITYQERYFGAKITSVVLKVFGALWLIAGVITITRTDRTYGNNGTSGNSFLLVLVIEVAATLLGTAFFAFFAYVLDLLRGIWEETAGEND
jgi:predicted ABC-type sugar transport system permease subunit